ncbi:MAG: CDP-alcohol phosphatidyltransferase family protein [Terriglobales bacterium]
MADVVQPPEGPRRRRPRKGMSLLPGLFTTANLALGYYAISQVMVASAETPVHFDQAAKAIGLAVLADGLDGRIARMTNTTSEFGKQLDSLADSITFGVAPAILAWNWGFRLLPFDLQPDFRARLIQFGAIATFLFLTAGVARLARFNIQINPQPSNPGPPGKKYFVGMPIPAGAGVIASAVHLAGGTPMTDWWLSALWLALILSVGFLMASTWRFYSFKDISLRQQRPFRIIILIGGMIALLYYFSAYVLFLMAMTYMFSGVLWRLLFLVHKPGSPPPAPPAATNLPDGLPASPGQ